jgi:AAA domain/NrS-1  polymerase HBD domain/IclR helix-turn-helix domain
VRPYATVPAELRGLRQWVVWRREMRHGKATKVPYRPLDPTRRASSTDPATWARFEEAVAAMSTGAGIGFVLVQGGGLVGVDLDDCIVDDRLHAEAEAIVSDLASYAEWSPGQGVHAWVRGTVPGSRHKSTETAWGGAIEVYDGDRFFTITGDHLDCTPRSIESRQEAVHRLYGRFFPPEPEPPPRPRSEPVSRSDAELLDRAFRSRGGDRFRALWVGDTTAYGGDQSAADLALCSDLAYWTGGDTERVDALFRSSGLMRSKWDERRGDTTYGARTIAVATTHREEGPMLNLKEPASSTGRNGHGPDPGKLRVLDTRRLLTTPPPPLNWLVDGIFAQGKLTLVGGREKGGKSLVQLVLAACMASGGGEVAGITVQAGRVLLVDAENGERETHRRLRAVGLDLVHASELVCVEARGFDLRSDLGQITSLIDRYEPALLLLDSFRALWRGDERDEAAVAAALDPLRDLAHDRDLAIGLTHHAQKAGDEYRGSSAIGASVEWVAMLSRVRADPDRTRRKLSTPLCRFAREREDRWLSILSQSDDGPITLAAAAAYRPSKPRDEKSQAVLDALTDDPQSGREIARQADVKEPTVRRILRDLDGDGLVEKRPSGWVRRDASSASLLYRDDARDAPEVDA